MSRDRSPQAKKARSLTRDRRNAYGENDKSSRTAIRGHKRHVHRVDRQALHQAIHREDVTSEDATIVPARRGRWRKCPDKPLGELLHARRVSRLEREVAARMASDPHYLDRLEAAAILHGVDPVAARMTARWLRAGRTGGRSSVATPITRESLATWLLLVRRVR
jgi:hypothetical protein